jgi:hypothetical protein
VGWHWPYDTVHHVEEDIHEGADGLGSALGWLFNTFTSFVVGLVVGGLLVALVHVLPFRRGASAGGH